MKSAPYIGVALGPSLFVAPIVHASTVHVVVPARPPSVAVLALSAAALTPTLLVALDVLAPSPDVAPVVLAPNFWHSIVASLLDDVASANLVPSASFAGVAPSPSLFASAIVHASTVHAVVAARAPSVAVLALSAAALVPTPLVASNFLSYFLTLHQLFLPQIFTILQVLFLRMLALLLVELVLP
ncbi:hypothetical protein F0562_010520 [Nyssa sinensis]|uniref:Uncharacterized protein n=1 Tax=Nyssa sinensis TaxID=561372 RepID=A0A5J5A173_9ASTE|nr:hypothetical protein F0562_010520 [Nyssa sinensis]